MQTSFDTPRLVSANPFSDGPTGSFYDDADASGSSDPWGSSAATTSTPGGASNSSNTHTVLDEAALPSIYDEAWRAASARSGSTGSSGFGYGYGYTTAAQISFASLHKTLASSAGLAASHVERIVNLVSGNSSPTSSSAGVGINGHGGVASPSSLGSKITRSEYFVALGLAALAQQKQSVSIENLSSRRTNPPLPKLDLSIFSSATGSTAMASPFPATSGFASTSPTTIRTNSYSHAQSAASGSGPSRQRKVSLGSTADPWNPNYGASGSSNPAGAGRPGGGAGTNGYNNFPAYSEEEPDSACGASYEQAGSSAGSGSSSEQLGLPPYPGAVAYARSLIRISVLQQPELQGTFLSRHTAYLVSSGPSSSSSIFPNAGSRSSPNDSGGAAGEKTVTRRYSDWVWLHEYLSRKYPARVILQLPPKRVGISARHIKLGATDEAFLDRRRRALGRYLNFVCNHHVLRKEKAVRVFLEEDMDLSVWRKMHAEFVTPTSTSTTDETYSLSLTPSQESSIPASLDSTIQILRTALPGLIESQTRVCGYLERVLARDAASAQDLLRARLSLDSFAEVYDGLAHPHHGSSSSSSSTTTSFVAVSGGRPKEFGEESRVLHRDIHALGEGLSAVSKLSETHSASLRDGVLEGLKLQRESWRGLHALLERYEATLKPDGVDKLKRRIEGLQSKHTTLREGNKAGWEEEGNKLLHAIEEDQGKIAGLLDRRAAMRYMVAQEMSYVWRYASGLGVVLASWAEGEDGHAKRVVGVWERLSAQLGFVE